MEPISILLLAAVLTKMVTTHREDMEYARHGQESPRYKLKMAQFQAAQKAGKTGGRPPARPGASGYLQELWRDAWDDMTERRRQARQERRDEQARQRQESLREWSRRSLNTRQDGRPIDDMVDLVGVREPHPHDPNNTRNCPTCQGEVVLDGRPCPRCLDAQERRNAEHDAALCPVCLVTVVPAGQQCPTCAFWRESDEANRSKLAELDEPVSPAPQRRVAEPQDALGRVAEGLAAARLLRREPGITDCDRCGREAHIDDLTPMSNGSLVELWCDLHPRPQRPEQQAAAGPTVTREVREQIRSDLYGKCAYREFIEGIGDQWCDMPVIGDDPYCGTHTPKPNTDTPLAPVIPLFPSIKSVEKEISMSEVNGLSTAIAYANDIANVHTNFATAGAEGYVGALERGGNSGEVIASAREAMEASGIAADKWAAHKAILEQQTTVKEAYQSQPDAADKDFLLNG